MRNALIIMLALGGFFLVVFLWAVVMTILRRRRFARLPPRPALRCPNCKSDQVDVLSSGLADTLDNEGRRRGGVFEYGICRQCDSRCARLIDDESFVPTDGQWQSHFGPLEKMRRDRANWPFESMDEQSKV